MVKAFFSPLSCIRRPVVSVLTLGIFSLAGSMVSLAGFDKADGQVLSVGAIAQAQTSQATAVTTDEVRSYARSVLDIEALRLNAFSQLAEYLGTDTVPSITCNNPSSVDDLDSSAREIVVGYCNESIAVVEGHDLTIARFNTITEMQRSNQALRDRIQQELLCLQTGDACPSGVN